MWERARSYVYDKAIVSFTAKWYLEVLQHLPENCHILDIGIGTGAALIANAAILRAKNITVVGVDYDAAYVVSCEKAIVKADLSKHISVFQESIYDFTPKDKRLFDHVYFSGSFMILPQPAEALRKVIELLVDREDGRVYITQTFELSKNALLEWFKPKMLTFTTIDFGNVSYEGDFDDALHEAGVLIDHMAVIEDGHRVDGKREARLIVARSKLYVPEEPETAT